MGESHAVITALTIILQHRFGDLEPAQYWQAAADIHPALLSQLYPYDAPKVLGRMFEAASPVLTDPTVFYATGGQAPVQAFITASKNLLAHTGKYRRAHDGREARTLKIPDLDWFDEHWRRITGWTWIMNDNDYEAAYVMADLREKLLLTHLLTQNRHQHWFVDAADDAPRRPTGSFDTAVAVFDASLLPLFRGAKPAS